jgi:DNA (cytosine-5)-methyltransferase 1
VLDLFCGAGGFSYGFKSAGFEIVAGIDRDLDSLKTFSKNFPKSRDSW